MGHRSSEQYGTYRCPVCGHRDGAEVEEGERGRQLRCSYCETPLEVSSRGPDSVRLSVQVSEEPAAR